MQIQEKVKYVHIGRGGWTGYFNKHHRVSHYGDTWKKYCEHGTPIIDTRTIPNDKLVKWALCSPMVDLEATESQTTKVEQNDGGLGDNWVFQHIKEHGHPQMRLAAMGNLASCTLEDYIKLAEEWGATVTYYGDEE